MRGGARAHPMVFLTSVTAAVAAREPHAIEQAIREAQTAGASREDLLGALEFAWRLARVPGSLVAFAYAAIQTAFAAEDGAPTNA